MDLCKALTGEFPYQDTQRLFSSTLDYIIYFSIFSIFFSPSVQASKLKAWWILFQVFQESNEFLDKKWVIIKMACEFQTLVT